jgi:hypothetical protein
MGVQRHEFRLAWSASTGVARGVEETTKPRNERNIFALDAIYAGKVRSCVGGQNVIGTSSQI